MSFYLKIVSMLPVMCAKPAAQVDLTKVLSAINSHHTPKTCLPGVVAPEGDYAVVPVKFSGETTHVKVLETCTGYYVKPTERIYKYGFEKLFGLGPGCLGYNENECVLLRK